VRAAVLGATGFVGRALVPALAQQGEVVAVSRRASASELPGVRVVSADLTDGESTRGFAATLVDRSRRTTTTTRFRRPPGNAFVRTVVRFPRAGGSSAP
jgi:nucleoside-diphosphate-sugar epimerase